MMSAALRLGNTMMSTIGGSRLVVLIYHRVLQHPDEMLITECDRQVFSWQMKALAEHFNVLPLGAAVDRLAEGSLPPRAACVTFDDGYADNATVALPVLQRFGLPATFFVATGYLDGGCMWNDSVIEAVRLATGDRLDLTDIGLKEYAIDTIGRRRIAIGEILAGIKYRETSDREAAIREILVRAGAVSPRDLMMTTAQLQRLVDGGMEVGGHTVSHPILAGLAPGAARDEIAGGKARLEELIGRPVRLFAYPNGKPGHDYNSAHAALVRECGFAAAVTTAWGVAGRDSDRYQLPRFTPWDRTPRKFLLRLLHNYARRRPAIC